MATIARLVNRQGRCLGAISWLCQPRAAVLPIVKQNAFISTSDKKKDVSTSVEPMENLDVKRLTKHFENIDKDNEENYTSYGFEPGDRDTDWMYHNVIMFLTITCGFIGGGFILAYLPDLKFRDWSHREAFLELDRREKLGLPLVDPNYVDPTTIELPSDEDTAEADIII